MMFFYISKIAEGSCDIEDCFENSALPSQK